MLLNVTLRLLFYVQDGSSTSAPRLLDVNNFILNCSIACSITVNSDDRYVVNFILDLQWLSGNSEHHYYHYYQYWSVVLYKNATQSTIQYNNHGLLVSSVECGSCNFHAIPYLQQCLPPLLFVPILLCLKIVTWFSREGLLLHLLSSLPQKLLLRFFSVHYISFFF